MSGNISERLLTPSPLVELFWDFVSPPFFLLDEASSVPLKKINDEEDVAMFIICEAPTRVP